MDFSALRKFPWNEEIYLAQQGDTQAVRRTCATAEPIVDQFGKVSYFVGWLGKDEVRSIASLALVEFIMSYSGGVPDEEIPALIKQVISLLRPPTGNRKPACCRTHMPKRYRTRFST